MNDFASMDYILTPILSWLVNGVLKFLVNSFQVKRWAFDLVGYGGNPSTHSAIVSGTMVLIGLKEGIASPAFGVAFTLMAIVAIDAMSLRRHIGKHAERINALAKKSDQLPLRERMGHRWFEVANGIVVGAFVALAVFKLPI